MVRKMISWFGNLCLWALILFSLFVLVKRIGSWTPMDYIWMGAIILFFIAWIGERLGSDPQK
ncbi:hypothetical protein [Caenibacillus caldisaponilyticus]|jgi:hypothetical protein|uniref:hypothetical protein n=1 Tax=Caenibacillus caldisaponilyticus TaxID=1674942 RepID=UPI0009887CB4|nr:hypothetical protein [Caenibacillus caldisaponilyticus]